MIASIPSSLGSLLTGAAIALSAQGPAPVRPPDFVVARLDDRTDSARARRILGRPDSITSSDHPFNVGARLIDWWYHDLRVSFTGTDTVSGLWLLGAKVATARGLRVGDSRARVRDLYGTPASIDSTSDAWVYHDSTDQSDLHLVKIFFKHNRVVRAFLGWVLD
jgi:hypothetical protein